MWRGVGEEPPARLRFVCVLRRLRGRAAANRAGQAIGRAANMQFFAALSSIRLTCPRACKPRAAVNAVSVRRLMPVISKTAGQLAHADFTATADQLKPPRQVCLELSGSTRNVTAPWNATELFGAALGLAPLNFPSVSISVSTMCSGSASAQNKSGFCGCRGRGFVSGVSTTEES